MLRRNHLILRILGRVMAFSPEKRSFYICIGEGAQDKSQNQGENEIKSCIEGMAEIVEGRNFDYLQADRVQQVKTVTHRAEEAQWKDAEQSSRQGVRGKHQQGDQSADKIVEISRKQPVRLPDLTVMAERPELFDAE